MTKKEIRLENIHKEMSNTKNPGAYGRAFELACARPYSKKTTVSKQGKTDVCIKVIFDGKARYLPAECKTNGGRVDDLLSGVNKSKFVIYKLSFTQKLKDRTDERKIPAVVIPTDLFLNMLKECNALKEIRHNGIVDGIAIQPSSKKMYNRLKAYALNYTDMVFNPTAEFESWQFEGLEL